MIVTPATLFTEKHTRSAVRFLVGMQIVVQKQFASEDEQDALAATSEQLIDLLAPSKTSQPPKYSGDDWSASWFDVETDETIAQEAQEELGLYKAAITHQYWMERT